ncbi:NAD dependent epimerase/dehydratase [Phyllosticta capitalensis]|uniref:NAD dependent epimerase/dehydratase n=1 Tax=Phyllosticta capitalensis TaxID=121624 RepID=A0ABR1YKJ9_9PEZI
MAPINNPVLPLGSTILVTGVNGFVAATLADVLLSHGYNVRGSVRDTSKNAWITSLFEQKYGSGRFELAHVPDIVVEGAFDKAMEGVAGVAHVAAILSHEPDATKVVPPSLTSMMNILESAAKTPSIKRFVLTSTAMTARALDMHDPVVLTQDSWNYDSLVNAWMPPPFEMGRGLEVYAAAKVASEKAMWKFAEERKPGFVCNSVLPALVFGRLLSPEHQGTPSSTHFVTALFKSNMEVIGPSTQMIKTFNYSDNEDVAYMHLAGLIHPDVQGERLWAYDKPCNWNDLLSVFRKNFPDRQFIDDIQGVTHDPAKNQPAERAIQLLKELGRPGLADMEQSIVKYIPQFA